MNLSKPRVDVGLSTNNLEKMLAFWQGEMGVPFDHVLPIRKGDVVNANQPVARVLRAADLWVKVFVPETELGKVRLGQEVTVSIDAYPGKAFQGTVQQIAGVSEFTPRNVQSVSERRHQVFAVKVRVADPQGAFHSGMAAEVVLPLHD